MLVRDEKLIRQYYQALLDHNESFTGIFYAAVRTTSVFCIASCRARKPKPEHVAFYTHFKDALDHGYRPCKICKPTENAHQAPEPVARAIQLVLDRPKEKISDYALQQQGISPEVVRRWFNKHYGMTFHSYQRMYRINNAFQELKAGKKTTDTAFESGYESLSGFGYTYKKMMGKSPKNSAGQALILISRTTTPIGPMFICATEKGVCLIEFVDRRMLETEFRDLQRLLRANIVAGENEHIRQAKAELEEYFAGTRQKFGLTFHTPGTDFQNAVWAKLQEIPFGATVSYQFQAEKINRPAAVRAVAAANGANRIAIAIPCHRVIGKNGHLTGYGGGLERKKWLLEHEQKFAGA